jgi:hypothetical protein
MTTLPLRLLAALALLLGVCVPSARAQAPARPTLVVVVVVDQLRPDYLDRHASRFTGGFKTLLERGAIFDAAYPYLNTVTCAGHTTLGTGAFPSTHGMILNAWYERAAAASRTCTEDASARALSYGQASGVAHSARPILVPTLAERIRETARGRVVSLSLKPRSAIGLAGKGGDVVVWSDDRGGWATSSAFGSGPAAFLQAFFDKNPIAADYGRTWSRMLSGEAYLDADDGIGERPPSGWDRTFEHPLGTAGGKPDSGFYGRWARSPFADEYLERMAETAIDALQLGKGAGTDFLGVSFSTLDLVGHAFGPASHEVQDVVLRLDRTLARLIAHLDARVGPGRYVLGLSSDHGVAPIPEQVPGAGRHTSSDVRTAIDGALTPIFGPPPARPGEESAPAARASYMAYSAYTDIYLAPGVLERLEGNREALAAVLRALTGLPGIAHAFPAREIATAAARQGTDPVRRAAALSYHPARSGDIIIVPRENWILSTAATTHGTLYSYDQRVPLILFGAGVRAGRHREAATPADLAPTLAALAGLTFEAPDGRALGAAVAPATAAK